MDRYWSLIRCLFLVTITFVSCSVTLLVYPNAQNQKPEIALRAIAAGGFFENPNIQSPWSELYAMGGKGGLSGLFVRFIEVLCGLLGGLRNLRGQENLP